MGAPRKLDIGALDDLICRLREQGYRIIAPTVGDGAVVYDEIEGADELPIGWRERQEPGKYRLERRDDDARFGFTVGPSGFKKQLFPPVAKVWSARKTADGFETVGADEPTPRQAFLGVRPCDLRAIAVQDRVFLGGQLADSLYARLRASSLIIAVNCAEPASTCFCTSMGNGPHFHADDEAVADLVLTELLDDGGGHRLLAEAHSELGASLLDELGGEPASEDELAAKSAQADAAASAMSRSMDPEGLRELLYRNLEHPRWEEVAERCLTCANCTLVCPTCFCSTVDDVADLEGENVDRWRRWDSCFTLQHSYLHGGSVRSSAKARYRQWLTHKLASWHDQFDTSGCVGCGRCITWCPVGIDLTEEIAALRADDRGATTGAWSSPASSSPAGSSTPADSSGQGEPP
ncbi:MAG: 4Fe-4S dicluster domain-containing protein [Holophagales bacterium]|nr:4Fe-4S dicluster domain-containing protein [Holophagales bacterium]